MNLLITGGAGFIGSNVIHHVIDRPEVTRLVNLDCLTYAGHLVNLEKVSRHPKYAFEKVDLRDKAAVLAVVQKHAHHARDASGGGIARGSVHHRPGRFHPHQCRRNFQSAGSVPGVVGGTAIQERESGSERFHHVSTDEVYGSRWARRDFSRRRRLTRPTRPTRRAKHPAICWCARIITPTGCRR